MLGLNQNLSEVCQNCVRSVSEVCQKCAVLGLNQNLSEAVLGSSQPLIPTMLTSDWSSARPLTLQYRAVHPRSLTLQYRAVHPRSLTLQYLFWKQARAEVTNTAHSHATSKDRARVHARTGLECMHGSTGGRIQGG